MLVSVNISMVKEKRGKVMRWSSVNPDLLLHHPDALLHFPMIRKISEYTMLSYTSLYNAYKHVRRVVSQEVPGAIVEMGCWNGGCGALMAKALKDAGVERDVWLFDSFEGLPQLTEEDKEWASKLDVDVSVSVSKRQPIGLYVAEVEKVKKAFSIAGLDQERPHIEKGWFQDSVPKAKSNIGNIAVLRLDGDTYDSTLYCLEELYPLVSPGGVVIIDDYHLRGCRQALYEYFVSTKFYPVLNKESYGGRLYFKKPMANN